MIRLTTQHDLPKILDIYNHAIVNTTAIYTYEKTTLLERKQWMQQKENDGFPIFVFEVEGVVAGFATYGPFRNFPAYKHTIEHSIYVSPYYRHMGIGEKLLEHLITSAREEGYKTMVAGIDSENKGSIYLHKKFGFTYNGTIKSVGYKFNKWLNLDFYQLLLK
ncbi:GNAT family N-acetyltransferase [Macrococcus armenti]|uniref:GNAT family N-acetyltransferase n=1 Tax=Macrococcus armenti TaxID=2875764 RepID=UPI001CCB6206|nr:GNAT family N-acetyltransferase [Macrococcus armenti]UBH15441.1 GNAT family N-acetyltransferase [Macrococcus armenti]UBH17801.1 GNAT family N-acetyltransferase [Macrococcus armenti]UBH20066.1 GNAT family N-acetyltransferase [Macrococcus armenti]